MEIQSLGMNSHIYGHKATWKKGNLFNKWYWIILIPIWKKWILTLTHTTHQILPGKTIDLNVKDKTVKLLEENIKHLYDPEVGNDFLTRHN